MNEYADYWDLVLPPFYILALIGIGVAYRNAHQYKREYYKYFIPAFVAKLFAAIAFCLVYTFYYEGGDTTGYYISARAYVNILFNNGFDSFMEVANFYSHNIQNTGYFNETNGYLYFPPHDYYALVVVLLTSPICLLAGKSFFATTILLSAFSFIGSWKLYELFIYYFPKKTKEFAYIILFIPSVIFWGSGILKDTYTYTFVGIYTYSIWKYFIIKDRKIKYIIAVVITAIFIILIKPYIFIALMPGSIIWLAFNRLKKIRNPFWRAASIPIVFATFGAIIVLGMSLLDAYLGEYSVDHVLDKAVKTQQDLIRGDQYGGNNFDIGKFDATISGILLKVPVAINLALFRPYLWDANNVVMLASGLENLAVLGFTIYVLFKVSFRKILKTIGENPLILFSIVFALFFAFSVGLTTANYGALVRLKIPCIPFYLATLLMIYELNKKLPIGHKE